MAVFVTIRYIQVKNLYSVLKECMAFIALRKASWVMSQASSSHLHILLATLNTLFSYSFTISPKASLSPFTRPLQKLGFTEGGHCCQQIYQVKHHFIPSGQK